MQHSHSDTSRLTVRHDGATGVRWWLADERWCLWAEHASSLVGLQQVPPRGVLLKQGTRRMIVRLPRPEDVSDGPGSVVVKAFPMARMAFRFHGRHRRLGPLELRHLEIARQRGLPAPEVYGYAEHRQLGLFVRNTAVLMEDLEPRPSVAAVLSGGPAAADLDAALATGADLILKLYAAGCNHIDLNANNVYLPLAGESEGRIIDFMYVRFHSAPSADILRFMTAYFARSVSRLLPGSVVDGWIAEVLARGGVNDGLGPWHDLVRYPDRRLPPRRQRLALT